jgi:hypothetical protein
MAAEAVLKGTVGQAVKDGYKALKGKVSHWASDDVAALENTSGSIGRQTVIAEIIDAQSEDDGKSARLLAEALISALKQRAPAIGLDVGRLTAFEVQLGNLTVTSGIGARIAHALEQKQQGFLVIEERAEIADQLHARSIGVIQGNATQPELLKAANLAGARWFISAIPNSFENGNLIGQARAANPHLEIIAPAHSDAEVGHLQHFGASLIIVGEREIAKGMTQHILESIDPAPLPHEPRARLQRDRRRGFGRAAAQGIGGGPLQLPCGGQGEAAGGFLLKLINDPADQEIKGKPHPSGWLNRVSTCSCLVNRSSFGSSAFDSVLALAAPGVILRRDGTRAVILGGASGRRACRA